MACVDEADLDACCFQDVVSRDPVGAGGFHGDGGDAVFEKPVAEVMEVLGEGIEAAHSFPRHREKYRPKAQSP